MSVTVDQLDAWRRLPAEHRQLEFKAARSGFDGDKLREYCVAIANERGGYLVLGVANEPPRLVTGTQACSDPNGMAMSLFNSLGFRVEISVVDHPDGRVVVVEIPSRPIGHPYDVNGKYLMRVGESLVAMSADQLRAIFAEGAPDWTGENAMTDVLGADIVRLLDTQAVFDLLELPYPPSRDGVLDRLSRERLIAGGPDSYDITNLGAILFAKRLDDFSGLSRRAPRVIVYDGRSKVKTVREQTDLRGYAVAFESLVQFVASQTPANEVIGQAFRQDIRMYPDIMLRETIANALIHQDFLLAGASVMIEIFADRLEVSNPGQPNVELPRFIDEYRTRNERLADLMRRIRICEEKGSGIDKVVTAAEAFQLPAPEFTSDTVRTICVLHGHKPFGDMDREARVRACYQHCCLRYVTRQLTTNQSLRERFGLPDERSEPVSRILKDTVEAGLIRPEEGATGSRKYARYVPFWA